MLVTLLCFVAQAVLQLSLMESVNLIGVSESQFCHTSLGASLPQLRLLARPWVLVVLQGFLGAAGNVCGKVPPHVSALACAGCERRVMQC